MQEIDQTLKNDIATISVNLNFLPSSLTFMMNVLYFAFFECMDKQKRTGSLTPGSLSRWKIDIRLFLQFLKLQLLLTWIAVKKNNIAQRVCCHIDFNVIFKKLIAHITDNVSFAHLTNSVDQKDFIRFRLPKFLRLFKSSPFHLDCTMEVLFAKVFYSSLVKWGVLSCSKRQ